MQSTAIISPCGRYRYKLTRQWMLGPLLPLVMLNPSTADAETDDPTIRRCMGFARREGAAGIVVVNRFAYRATDPAEMFKASDPFGRDNDATLLAVALMAAHTETPIVCAWGAASVSETRTPAILLSAGATLVCLGKTKHGRPRHPLYVRADQPFVPYP